MAFRKQYEAIFLFPDSLDFSFVQTLDVESQFGFKSRYPMAVMVAVNDDHLFANVTTSKGLAVNLVSLFFR